MPSVPRLNNQREEAALPSVRANPNAPIEAFGGGQGANRVTEGIRDVAEMGLDIYAQERKKADDIMIRDVDIASAELEGRVSSGVAAMKGMEAGAAPDYLNDEWSKGVEDIKSRLKTENQRVAAENILLRRRMQLEQTAQTHMRNEFDKYNDERFKVAQDMHQAEASMKYNRPGMIENSLAQQFKEIDSYADGKGGALPDGWRENEKAIAKSRTYRQVLERMYLDGLDNKETMKAAEAYSGQVEKFLRPDDVQILARFRKDEKERSSQRKSEMEKELYLILADTKATTQQQLDALERNFKSTDLMDVSTYDKAKKWVLSEFDLKEIPYEEKIAAKKKIQEAFVKLNGVELDDKGNPSSPPSGNDFKTISEFRAMVAENKQYMPMKEYKQWIEWTQADFDAKLPAKKNFLDSLQSLMIGLPSMSTKSQLDLMSRAIGIFDPKIPIQQAADEITKLKQEAVAIGNPKASKYIVGEVYPNAYGVKAIYKGIDESTGKTRWETVN